jgi:hypothetical protein
MLATIRSSHLLSKNLKIRICKTIILPVVLYGCQNWPLTLREKHRLRVFENRVLRKIFGPKKEVTGEWRKRNNKDFYLWVLHPVAYISNWFFMMPSFATKFQYIKTKLHGLSPRANYTDRATAACRLSDCQLLRIEGATWSVWRIPMAVFSIF